MREKPQALRLNLSLKTKMTLVVSLLAAAGLSLITLSAAWYFEKQFKETISRQQFTMVAAMAEEIDSKIRTAQTELLTVASTLTPSILNHPVEAQSFLDNRPDTAAMFDSGVFLFSPQGKLLAVAPLELQLIGKDYAFRDYLKETVKTGKPQISEPFFSTQESRHPIIMFTAPVFDAGGKLSGILAGSLDLMKDNFLGKLATVKIGSKGYFYLYNNARTLIVHPDRNRILKQDVPVGANRLFDLALQGFEGTGETINSRGLHLLSTFKRLQTTNWIFAANYPQSEAYAPIYQVMWYLLALFVVMLFLSILIAWGFMRHMTMPLLLFIRHVEEITARDGQLEPIPVKARDEIGTLAQAFNRMVAEVNQQKKAVLAQKAFSTNLLEVSAVPTFVLDNRHRVIVWNKACEELTGAKATEMIGNDEPWRPFYPEKRPVLADIVLDGNHDDLPSFYDKYSRSPLTPDGLQSEGWYASLNGKARFIFFDAAPVHDSDGRLIAAIETLQDITERKQTEETLRWAEEELQKWNRELESKVEERTRQLFEIQEELVRGEKLAILGQLSGSVGHELRNPLGVMSNAVYFLKMVLADADETVQEYLEIIKKEIDNSLQIITDLLDFARTRPPRTTVVTTRELTDESLSRCTIPGNVELQSEIPDNLPLLRVDPLQLGQVLTNFITNAVQAMPSGGTLRIVARLVGAGLVPAPEPEGQPQGLLQKFIAISVTDSGEGIAPENMEKLFQPLFTTKAKGIGLGLVVCKNLVAANGGRIEVESAPEKGTTFTVVLPIEGEKHE
jgi:PAS domain S-box-containing protein